MLVDLIDRYDIDVVFQNIKEHIDPDFQPVHGLDFGCGVGRLLFAISTRCEHSTGVDVSPSMLAESSSNSALKLDPSDFRPPTGRILVSAEPLL